MAKGQGVKVAPRGARLKESGKTASKVAKTLGVIKSNGLDQGLAASHTTRSNSMWMAEKWDDVVANYNGNQHNPIQVRQECREAGHEWAFVV